MAPMCPPPWGVDRGETSGGEANHALVAVRSRDFAGNNEDRALKIPEDLVLGLRQLFLAARGPGAGPDFVVLGLAA
eukprot:4622010-Lingulodinium_polyedra.AAC.1